MLPPGLTSSPGTADHNTYMGTPPGTAITYHNICDVQQIGTYFL